jgi:hypothetical protein
MTLKTRIDKLERRAGIGEPLKLTIAFYDSVLNGSISEEEFARYAPALRGILPEEAYEYRCDEARGRPEMLNIRKRILLLESFQSQKGGTTSDQIVRRSAGACFGRGVGLARKRGACRSARTRVNAGGIHRSRNLRLRSVAGIDSGEITARTTETTKMISKSLSGRLERLETSIMPTSTTRDPLVIELQFVSAEKVVTSSMSLEVDLPAPPVKKRVGDEGY